METHKVTRDKRYLVSTKTETTVTDPESGWSTTIPAKKQEVVVALSDQFTTEGDCILRPFADAHLLTFGSGTGGEAGGSVELQFTDEEAAGLKSLWGNVNYVTDNALSLGSVSEDFEMGIRGATTSVYGENSATVSGGSVEITGRTTQIGNGSCNMKFLETDAGSFSIEAYDSPVIRFSYGEDVLIGSSLYTSMLLKTGGSLNIEATNVMLNGRDCTSVLTNGAPEPKSGRWLVLIPDMDGASLVEELPNNATYTDSSDVDYTWVYITDITTASENEKILGYVDCTTEVGKDSVRHAISEMSNMFVGDMCMALLSPFY